MPPGILDLPTETLHACFSGLLPSLDDKRECIKFMRYYPLPPHLLHSRLVCRTFNRIASPLIWRRVELRAADRLYPTRPIHMCAHLLAYPTSASHIRALHLYLSNDIMVSIATLPSLLAALRLMSNIRVVTLVNVGKYGEILAEVLRKTRIHTLMVVSQHDSLPPLIGSPAVNIQNLSFSGVYQFRNVLQLMPHLRTLSIADVTDSVGLVTLPIPWVTLHALDLWKIERWDLIVNDFKTWNQRNVSVSSPLVELQVGGISMGNDAVEHLLRTFSLQPLRTLILYIVPNLDLALLDRIVTSFPDLKDLTLYRNGVMDPWNGDLDQIVAILAKLKRIEALDWDHFHPEISTTDDELMLKQMEDIVSILGNSCPKLTRLIYSNGHGNDRAIFHIQRGDNDEYQGWRFQGWDGVLPDPYTLAWSTRNRLFHSV